MLLRLWAQHHTDHVHLAAGDFTWRSDCIAGRFGCDTHRTGGTGPDAAWKPTDVARPGLRGLWLTVPDRAVAQDVAVGASPLDFAAFELLLVQRRVRAVLA
jgi:hypothetical protein